MISVLVQIRKFLGNVGKFTETKEVHFLYQCTKDELCKMNYASSNAISQRTFIKSDMQRELVDALISMSVLGEIESPDNHSPVEMQMSE